MKYRHSRPKLPARPGLWVLAVLGLSFGTGYGAPDSDGQEVDSDVTNIQIGPGSSATSGKIVIDGKVVGGGDGDVVEGSGKKATERRALDDFHELTVEIGADITLRAGAGPAVVIHADDNVVPLIVTQKRGDKLTLLASRSFSARQPVAIELSVPHITSVSLEGSGSLDMSGVAEDELVLNIEGSADVTARGRVDNLSAEINGTGDLHLGSLAAKSARVAIEGSGDAEVSVADSLVAEINGSGNIVYSGSPRKVKKEINGVGRIIPKGQE